MDPAKLPADGFRERIFANWTDAQTVGAWRRWHAKIARQMAAVSDALVELAWIGSGMTVLDLASGSGEPALQIARAVGINGHVTATDISDDMLGNARENAASEGLLNLTFRRADAESLPFADESFDAVTCRMGVMFFVEADRALREVHRVLRPGGRVALSAWGPAAESSFFTAIEEPFARRAQPPEAPAGAPHRFRFATSGSLCEELRRAGFADACEETRVVGVPWPGDRQEFWEAYYELAAPAYFDELPERERQAAFAEVMHNLGGLESCGSVQTQAAIVFASARR